MLVRDSVSHLRTRIGRYVCPICLSRNYATPSWTLASPVSLSHPKSSQTADGNCRNPSVLYRRPFATTREVKATGAALAASASPLENTFSSPIGLRLEEPEDVRDYLKKWSQKNQKSLRENAPEQVQLFRRASLPNSLFIRNNDETAGWAEDKADDVSEVANFEDHLGSSEDVDGTGLTTRVLLEPGDALRFESRVGRVRSQLAVYLGTRETQSLYLLSDGRWHADTQCAVNSHVIRGFASSKELSRLEPHLPVRAIEYQKAEDGAIVPFTASGEIPHADSRGLLGKLAALNEELEEAKRRYPNICDQLYEHVADESELKFEHLHDLLQHHLQIDVDALTEGTKMFFHDSVFKDARLSASYLKGQLIVVFIARKMYNSMVIVTQWARSYQDAAARASTGKNVSSELHQNPLLPFISKARRLISRSRKIRLPTVEGELGLTTESLRPPLGAIERRPTGEEFTDDEKKIIEFLWLVYVRRPTTMSAGSQRNAAIASLIVRAVGAYPKFTLNSATGSLFLKELGCLDPWAQPSDYLVTLPATQLGLHQPARLAKEKVAAATAALGLQPGQEGSPFPDTMAHLRKDWGDLEVFLVDSASTKVVDDGVSIEPSHEFPDHHWIHVHVAHPSAFIPYDSPLLAQGETMGATYYSLLSPDPYIPYDAVMPYSLKPNAPALTISTLLAPDGSIKNIDITPSIVRNIVKIHNSTVNTAYNLTGTLNTLKVGMLDPAGGHPHDTESQREQAQLLERHRPTLDLLQKLVLSRWEARYRESPEHLQMLKLPNCKENLRFYPEHAFQASTYERIFRSEHVLGDLSVSVTCEVSDYNNVNYRNQTLKRHQVTGAMLLASEATALWASARKVPVVYRYSQLPGSSQLSSLNNLGTHDAYVGVASGESLEMSRNLALSMAGYVHVTSPLRRYRDLMNHYQIDAYLRAQANSSEGVCESSTEIDYAYTRQDLAKMLKGGSDGSAFALYARLQKSQHLTHVLYRAFYFQEAKLPDIWDVYMDNPVNISGNNDPARLSMGTVYALGAKVHLERSEEGWEKLAKFRQYLPCKLTQIIPGFGRIYCKAVGPPSDQPSVKDLAYPALQVD